MKTFLRISIATLLAGSGLQSHGQSLPRWESIEDVDHVSPRRVCPYKGADRALCELLAVPIAFARKPIFDQYPRVQRSLPPRYALVIDAIMGGGQTTTRLGYRIAGADLRKMLIGTVCDSKAGQKVRVKLNDMDVMGVEIEPVLVPPTSVVASDPCVTAVLIESGRPISNSDAVRLVRDLLTSHTEALSRSATDYSDSFLPPPLWGGPSRLPFAIVDGGSTAKTIYVAPAFHLEAAGYDISTFVARSIAPTEFSDPRFPRQIDFLPVPVTLSFENWNLYYAVVKAPVTVETRGVSVKSLLAGLP